MTRRTILWMVAAFGLASIARGQSETTRSVFWPRDQGEQDLVLEVQWLERFRITRNIEFRFAEFEYVPV